MRVFLTGATGYVGSRVARKLMAAGHTVVGMVRNEERRAALPHSVEAVVADLADPATVVNATKPADAVLHLGFPSHGRDLAAAVAVERALLEALVAALAGGDKALVVSNGTAFYGSSKGQLLAESTVPEPGHPAAIRADATALIHQASGLRSVELRLASFVYGAGGSVFLPRLAGYARRTGRSLYVGEGRSRVSAVHVDAAADAYVAALASPDARGIYHIASDDAPSVRTLAEAVAVGTGANPTSVTLEEAAAELDPFTAMFLALDNGLSSRRARRELGWEPAGHPSLLWDVAYGSYRDAAES